MIKSNKSIRYIFAIILLLLILLFNYLPSSALENPAITVTPGVLNVELTEPNQTVESEIEVSSNYAQETILDAGLSGVDESSGVLVANGPLNSELEKSMSLSSSQIVVPANGKTTFSLKVTNSDLLSPGGHYAAVTLSQVSKEGSQVNLQSTISISVFIVKRGGEKVDFSIQNQTINLSPFRLPTAATITYLNTGNVFVTPRASITIRSLDGQKVYAKGVSNEGSLSILPGKTLENTFPITKIAKLPIIPTKLKYITEYRVDGAANAQYTELSSWYIPPIFIIFITSLIILIVIILTKFIRKRKSKKQKAKINPRTTNKPKGELISDITPISKKNPNKSK